MRASGRRRGGAAGDTVEETGRIRIGDALLTSACTTAAAASWHGAPVADQKGLPLLPSASWQSSVSCSPRSWPEHRNISHASAVVDGPGKARRTAKETARIISRSTQYTARHYSGTASQTAFAVFTAERPHTDGR